MPHDEVRTIRVSASGHASTTPDVATANVGIALRRRTVGEATSEAAALATGLVDAVKRAGVDASDVQTADYSVFPEHDHQGQQPVVVGYRVSYTLQIAVRDIDSLTDVLEAVAGAGGDSTMINGLSFSVADDTEARSAARELAWKGATAKAQQLARLSGLELGAAIEISEGKRGGGGGRRPRPLGPERAMSAKMAPPMESGQSAISVLLHVVFEATVQ